MAITIGAIDRAVTRGDVLPPDTSLDELGEIEQHLQIEISGNAGGDIAWGYPDVTFDVEFLDATDQRYSNLTTPQFTFGSEITSSEPVVVTACLRAWIRDDRDVIVGATVAIGAHNPGPTTIGYEGAAHLTFAGFGSLPNEPADPDLSSS